MTPSTSNPVELVRSLYDAYARQDAGTVVQLIHPEAEIIQTPLLPWGGIHKGHAGVQNFSRLLAEHIDGGPKPTDYIPAGDSVAVIARLSGKTRKTGRAFDMPVVHVWTIKDNLLFHLQAYIDTPVMLAALAS